MLQHLHVENYALIEKLDLSFDNGLTVITGETGAGKSILLGALSMILGQRADNRVIQTGRDKCISEAVFDVSSYDLETYFAENDLEYDAHTCIIRRELYSNGKSRAFVNDSPVSLNTLKDLSGKLMDIHSQHQNLLIGSDLFALSIVDMMAQENELLISYKQSYTALKATQAELRKKEEAFKKANDEEDYLRYQFEQLDAANLREGEQEELEAESQTLAHTEEIKLGLSTIFALLDEDEHGIVHALKSALNKAVSIQKVFPKIEESLDRIQTSYLDMKDLAREMEIISNDVEVKPKRLELIDERLSVLYSLQQKHKVKSNEELLQIKGEIQRKLDELNSSDESIQELKSKIEILDTQIQQLAEKLSKARKLICPTIEDTLTTMLKKLGMPKAVLKVVVEKCPLNTYGIDDIRFQFSANGGNQLQPIDKIASGGEVSRIMLCIKSMIAESTFLPTLLFDEIDTGISGEIAHKMGEIMKLIAQRRQVICITHLPQIAVKGKQHFKVHKSELYGNTITSVSKLNAEDRLTEVALMLSGANLTDAALHNARQLLLENQTTI